MKTEYRRKPIMILVLILTFVSFSLGSPVQAASHPFDGGEGTENNPYQISSAAQLDAVRNYADSHFVLTADIDLSGYSNWEPIDELTGTLDGQGYTIRNLTISRSDENNVGLFSYLNNEHQEGIRNLHLVDVNVTGQHGVGALVGRVTVGTIDNVHVDSGSVTGTATAVGGLTGRIDQGEILNSSAQVNVTGTGTGTDSPYGFGGLVGRMEDGTLNDTHATGDVEGPYIVGGLVGRMASGTISNSDASGNVTATIQDAGGLVGKIYKGMLQDTFASGDVTGNNHVGGLTGRNQSSDGSEIEIIRSHASGSIQGNGKYVGGLMGSLNKGSVTESYATGDVYNSGKNTGGLIGIIDEGTVSDSYATGDVSSDSAYAGGLIGIIKISGTVTNSYATGNVHTTNYTADYVGGLIGKATSATIQQVYAEGNVNVSEAGNYIAPSDIGGLIGIMDGGTVSDAYASGNVVGSMNVGGLIGTLIDATVERSSSSGTVRNAVTGGGGRIGGLVGWMKEGSPLIAESSSSSDVTGGNVGGLVGVMERGEIRDSNASGNINVTSIRPGGGLIGTFFGGKVHDNYALGNVVGADGSCIGGLVGKVQTDSDYTTGKDCSWGIEQDDYEGAELTDNYALMEEVWLQSGKYLNTGHAGKIAGYVEAGATVERNRALHTMSFLYPDGENTGDDGILLDLEVVQAETTKSEADIDAAFDVVTQIPYEPVRWELLQRLYNLKSPPFTLVIPDSADIQYTNESIVFEGKAFGDITGGLSISASLYGIEKSVTIDDLPSTEPTSPNVRLEWSVSEDGIPDGTYNGLEFDLKSDDGYLAQVSSSQSWMVDTVPPLLEVEFATADGSQPDTSQIITEAVTVTSAVYDTGSPTKTHLYRINDGSWQSYIAPIQLQDNGTYKLQFKAEDEAGNVSEYTQSLTLDVQTHQVIVTPASDQIGNEEDTFQLDLKIWDAGAEDIQVSAVIGGIEKDVELTSPPQSEPDAANVTLEWEGSELAEGTYSDIEIIVEAASGTVVLPWNGKFIVDKHPPQVDFKLVKADGSMYDPNEVSLQTVTVTADVYDALSEVTVQQYKINDASWQTYTGAIELDETGTYELQIQVEDLAGNRSDYSTKVRINLDKPIITLLGDNPLLWPLNEPYVDPGYSASSSYFGDLTDDVTVTGDVYVDEAGFYTLTYQLTDPSGLAADPVHRTVTVYDPYAIHQLSFDQERYELNVGDSHQTVVEAVYENGDRVNVTDFVQFTSSDETIVTIDAQGRILALQAGSANVLGLYEGIIATAEVTVSQKDEDDPGEDQGDDSDQDDGSDQDEDSDQGDGSDQDEDSDQGDGSDQDEDSDQGDDSDQDDKDEKDEEDSEQIENATEHLITYRVSTESYTTEAPEKNEQGVIELSIPEQGSHIVLDIDYDTLISWKDGNEPSYVHIETSIGQIYSALNDLLPDNHHSLRIEFKTFSSFEQRAAESFIRAKGGEAAGQGLHIQMYTVDENGGVKALAPLSQYVSQAIHLDDLSQTTNLAPFAAYVDFERKQIAPVPTMSVTSSSDWIWLNHFSNQSYIPIFSTTTFTDMEGHWAQEEVEQLASSFIVSGYTDHRFLPEQSITRAEFVTMLVKGLGLLFTSESTEFTDISDDEWYAPYVSSAVSQGWIQGYPDGSFRPNQKITREEMAVILNQIIEHLPQHPTLQNDLSLDSYQDGNEVSAFAKEAFEELIKQGILFGQAGNRLAPSTVATRAEAASIVFRMLEACFPADVIK